jgi:excisionase family DNA binding protein
MRDELLTVDQVAQIVGLHPRTVRRYIREGSLKAKKLGKQWRIQRRDVDALTGKEANTEEAVTDSEAERVHVSAVVDIRVDNEEEADRVFNAMLAAVTGKGPEYGVVHYESLYLRDEQKARLLFWGDAAFIGGALITVHRVSSSSG